jgi:hypothetical protein
MSAVGVDVARGICSGEAFLPRQLFLNGVGIAAASTLGLSVLLPESMNRSGWLDLANKLSAYRLFASADRLLGDSPDAEGLAGAVERVRGLDRYASVWSAEGIGYYYALRGGQLGRWQTPRHVRVPLHTGAGLARAGAALRSSPELSTGQILADFWEECGTAARDGYHEVLFEAIGLVAATLYPNVVSEMARHKVACSEEQRALFWHGVGRGLYFSPIGFSPLAEARKRAFALALSWPASDIGQQNAVAGLAWAVTLINVRDPEVLLCWLKEHADEIRRNDAFRNGVTSALIVWLSASPEDPFVEALRRFQPKDADSNFARLWQDTVGRACSDARRLYDADLSGDLAARVFRVRPPQI